MRSDALIAVTRFGLGPRPGDLARVRRDPRGYVLGQLHDPAGAELTGLPTRKEIWTAYEEHQTRFQMARRVSAATDGMEADARRIDYRKARNRAFRGIVEAEIDARFRRGAITDAGLVERLVLFWSNHFAIDRTRSVQMTVLAGIFEREAIRPHVLGNFEDMLFAATLHPAMLNYLDNDRNIAPNSRMGRRRGVGAPNENLARELLELHTLGAQGGYSQADVQGVAYILAGWTGGFHVKRTDPFDWRYHDDGPRTVLGRTYTAEGEEQVEALLPDLAAHPSTAAHIAGKFARHFLGELAPQSVIDALETSFRDSGGDLYELTRTLVGHADAWAPQPVKSVPPYDFIVSSARAMDAADLGAELVVRSAKALAQDIWAPPSPAGWPDDDTAFLGGDSLLERIDFSGEFVGRMKRDLGDVRTLSGELFGADLDPIVAEAIDRAESQQQAAVLLLMSPLFQRR